MASSAITSSIFQEIQNFTQSRRTDLQQLASALQSGNLDAAKQAFGDLAAIGKNGPYGNAEPFSNSSRAQALEAIGQALQAGDLAGAQAAFAALRSTFANRSGAVAAQQSPAVIVNIDEVENDTGLAMLRGSSPSTNSCRRSAKRGNPTSPNSARPCNRATPPVRNKLITRWLLSGRMAPTGTEPRSNARIAPRPLARLARHYKTETWQPLCRHSQL